ncbi:MAG: hypothetical protein R2942_08005 [Ignavibacteria bacterium]
MLIGTPDLVYYKDQNLAPGDAKVMKSSGLKYDTYNSAVLFEPEFNRMIFRNIRRSNL